MSKPKIIFMGTPEFGAIILENIIKEDFPPILTITSPNKPVGRKQIPTPPPVKVVSEKYKISVLQPKEIKDAAKEISLIKPDLIVVAAFGRFLPEEILKIPKYGSLNLHPSLLPKYRGSSPIQYAILQGEKETGTTIFLIDNEMDHGPILSQEKTTIGKNETAEQLHNRLAVLSAKLLINTIPAWLRKEIKLKPQDEEKATYTKILKKGDGKIDWKKTAEEIENKIRAFYPWPGSFTFWKKKDIKGKITIKILKARVLKNNIDKKTYPIGKTLIAPPNSLCIQCKKGFLIADIVQEEGKKPMKSEDFIRGHKNFIGTILK
ncbi:MAG: methionyl-tRNA formyltransferase [Candidatus Nealsonbacteria bacterium]